MAENKKPPLKFKTNIPIEFIFIKKFWQKEDEKYHKMSYGISCKVNGEEETMFIYDGLWDKIKNCKEGDIVKAVLEEYTADDKKQHKQWVVTINGEAPDVSKTKPIAEAGEKKDEYLKQKANGEQEKTNSIRWMNALNNATAIVCAIMKAYPNAKVSENTGEEARKTIIAYANFFYSLQTPLFNNDGDPQKGDEPF